MSVIAPRVCARMLAALSLVAAPHAPLAAQENYEIQVYASPTMAPGHTIFELHSNIMLDGRRTVENGVLPTHRQQHYTVEITRGITDWFETGIYLFTARPASGGFDFVGAHLRPRVRAPDAWGLPVGLSLSTEFGWQRREFAEDDWNIEIRPIIDRKIGRLYLDFNPTVGKSFHGATAADGFTLEPAGAVTVDVTGRVNLGAEYYGGLGTLRALAPANERDHLLFGVMNLNVHPDYEVNLGVGFGLRSTPERRLVKLILGRRF